MNRMEATTVKTSSRRRRAPRLERPPRARRIRGRGRATDGYEAELRNDGGRRLRSCQTPFDSSDDARNGRKCMRRATSTPAPQPGARPSAGGLPVNVCARRSPPPAPSRSTSVASSSADRRARQTRSFSECGRPIPTEAATSRFRANVTRKIRVFPDGCGLIETQHRASRPK